MREGGGGRVRGGWEMRRMGMVLVAHTEGNQVCEKSCRWLPNIILSLVLKTLN